MIGDFHFLRPWWLLAVLPALLLAWGVHRRSDPTHGWRGIVADHLVPFLVRGAAVKRRIGPVLFLLAGWIVCCVALAGPSWRREPSPFADEVAPIVIVIKVSPSMTTEDVPPSRLIRSVQKVHDLLAHRGKSKTALIAYAGSAHAVMPLTVDPGIIDNFAASLDPEIMPSEGDAAAEALGMADHVLKEAGGGSILWITDGIAPEQATALAAWRKQSTTTVHLLAPLPESPELASLRKASDVADATVLALTADDSDIDDLARASKSAGPVAGGESERWQDAGYWLTPLVALLLVPFFRKGWMPALAART